LRKCRAAARSTAWKLELKEGLRRDRTEEEGRFDELEGLLELVVLGEAKEKLCWELLLDREGDDMFIFGASLLPAGGVPKEESCAC
jgi:hypothetical protein